MIPRKSANARSSRETTSFLLEKERKSRRLPHGCTHHPHKSNRGTECKLPSGFVKVGYASENFPRSIFPSMVGRPILRAEEAVVEGVTLQDVMCGDEAAASTPARNTFCVIFPPFF